MLGVYLINIHIFSLGIERWAKGGREREEIKFPEPDSLDGAQK